MEDEISGGEVCFLFSGGVRRAEGGGGLQGEGIKAEERKQGEVEGKERRERE